MKQKWIFTGAAFALAMTLTGCRDNAAASISQPSSQEQTKDQTQMIPMEEAQEVALKAADIEAADADISATTLGEVAGVVCYKVEFTSGEYAYAYTINAETGEIISFAYEEKTMGADSRSVMVSEADAKKTALDRVSGATDKDIYEWKLDYDDGRPEYEGKIIYGGTEYEFTIDAATGSVMEWDAEKVR